MFQVWIDRGKLVVLLLSAIFCAFLTGYPAHAAEKNTLRLGVISDLIMHLPLFVAQDRNFFADENLAVERSTKFGKFRTSVSLINDEVDIILQDIGAYFELADTYGADAYRIVGGLTATAGSVVIARDPVPSTGFAWKQLRQKRFLGRDKNSTPMYFLRSVLTMNGVDPANVLFNTTAPVPARVRIWGRDTSHDYALFFEPDASGIIRQGKGHFATMLGPAVGKIDFTVFIVRSAFLKSAKNRNAIQRFMNALQRSLNWTASASTETLATIAGRYSKHRTRGGGFRPIPREDLTSGIDRYRSIGFWKQTLRVAPRAITDIQRLIIQGGGTKTKKHRCYGDVVDPRFARAAMIKSPPAGPIEKLEDSLVPVECG